jgi:hypothetical protein
VGAKPSPADRWDAARAFALRRPAAAEDRPWGDTVIKVRTKPGVPRWRTQGEGVHGPMFVWLGRRDADAPAMAVKLTASSDTAVALAGAAPTTMSGLGQWGWLTVRLEAADDDLVEDWIEESYRNVAPKRIVAGR